MKPVPCERWRSLFLDGSGGGHGREGAELAGGALGALGACGGAPGAERLAHELRRVERNELARLARDAARRAALRALRAGGLPALGADGEAACPPAEPLAARWRRARSMHGLSSAVLGRLETFDGRAAARARAAGDPPARDAARAAAFAVRAARAALALERCVEGELALALAWRAAGFPARAARGYDAVLARPAPPRWLARARAGRAACGV